ncbi:phosphodiesterase [Caballeronia ptereochthonis]|uniref:Phosphodiesterase n=1 Tax=Caballeronia ptereochthonis TaxID=1777144 RepID=A0A158DL73_9BURK|nr:phosphodiesterase [Caballeronia ptereochthonis]SAK95223.1 phosphodiesterase [Caballeronia ptereochthonis]
MLLAQISDLHITPPGTLAYGRVDTAAYLVRAIDALNALDPRPDAVLVTGDLVDAGGIDEYRHLRTLLDRLAMPWRVLVGNHDDRGNLRAVFGDRPELAGDGGFVQYAYDVGEVRVIVLDTLDPGLAAGRLCAARLAWLEAQLEACREQPVVIGMHHPPFACGIGFMDDIRLAPDDSRALEALLRRHPNVERIVCGHVHRAISVRFGGTIVWCAPSTAHQVALQLNPGSPDAFVMEPPAFGLHLWRADLGLVTHCVSVEQGGGPQPF